MAASVACLGIRDVICRHQGRPACSHAFGRKSSCIYVARCVYHHRPITGPSEENACCMKSDSWFSDFFSQLLNHGNLTSFGGCWPREGTAFWMFWQSVSSMHRALEWLFLELYLTGRQPETAPVKAPPSPMSSSSSDSGSTKPKRYVRCAPAALFLSGLKALYWEMPLFNACLPQFKACQIRASMGPPRSGLPTIAKPSRREGVAIRGWSSYLMAGTGVSHVWSCRYCNVSVFIAHSECAS